MNSTDRQSVKVYGPASLSNLGPGFDTLGLCLKGIGDIIEARFTSGQEITITSSAPIPLVASENTAGRAAHLVMTKAADKRGSPSIHKKRDSIRFGDRWIRGECVSWCLGGESSSGYSVQ